MCVHTRHHVGQHLLCSVSNSVKCDFQATAGTAAALTVHVMLTAADSAQLHDTSDSQASSVHAVTFCITWAQVETVQ
jgi:hypothetical protein